jgi:hypothetical protein
LKERMSTHRQRTASTKTAMTTSLWRTATIILYTWIFPGRLVARFFFLKLLVFFFCMCVYLGSIWRLYSRSGWWRHNQNSSEQVREMDPNTHTHTVVLMFGLIYIRLKMFGCDLFVVFLFSCFFILLFFLLPTTVRLWATTSRWCASFNRSSTRKDAAPTFLKRVGWSIIPTRIRA